MALAEQHLYPKPPQQQQQQQQQGSAGVRAEPVFIRDPSALESLSSVLTGVSSYVANTLPASFSMPARGLTAPSSPGLTTSTYYYPNLQTSNNSLLGGHQDNMCVLTNGDVVLFSAFDWIDSGSLCTNRFSRSSRSTEDGTSAPRKLQIYSLASHRVVETLDFGEGPDHDISAIDVNERGIVVALNAPGETTRLYLLNQLTLQPLHAKQTVLNDVAYPGVFDLGTRLLAYVTTSEIQTDTTDSKHGEHEAESGAGYQDLAKGVAKEVFGGVKMLGGFAHQTFSSYWSGSSGAPAASTSPPAQPGISRFPHRHARRASASVDYPDRVSNHPHRRRHDDSAHKREAVGTVMVRDFSLPGVPVIAHFKPHDHPITGCKFSPSGRLLLTTSRQGNVFHVHEFRSAGSKHMYKLARGITHASIEDIVFNEDETWVAVTTSRGTTHLYAINPFGGIPDVGAHMFTGVVNWTSAAIDYPTSLNALSRIKQRHHVPDIILSEQALEGIEPQTSITEERRRDSLRRQHSQDSLSSTGTGTSDQSQGYLGKLQQHYNASGGGRQRAMIAAHFLPSTTVFASDPNDVGLYPDEYNGGVGEPFDYEGGEPFIEQRHSSQVTPANPSTLLINRSKAPPVSTATKIQSKASHLWQSLSPPAAAVMHHAAHGLASLPGLVKETSRIGPVATMRSRTASWTVAQQSLTGVDGTTNGTHNRSMDGRKTIPINNSEAPLAVQQQLASQGSLSDSERGPSFADIYVFNPLGMLTLHRCWISSVRNKKTINGRTVETSELVLAPEDVVEWSLNRSEDWAPVKRSLAPRSSQQGKAKKASHWKSQAEIHTYNTGINSGWKGQYPLLNHGNHVSPTITFTQPQDLLWKSNQFTFQTYIGSIEEIQQEFAEGKLPKMQTQTLRRGYVLSINEDGRSADVADASIKSKPWISGMPMLAGNGSFGDHERGDSYDGEPVDLSGHISSAIVSGSNGYSLGSSAPSYHSPNRLSQQMQGRGITSRVASPSPESPDLSSLGRTIRSVTPVNSVAQEAFMFSPDGDNEVDLPGSESMIGGDSTPANAGSFNGDGFVTSGQTPLPHGRESVLDDGYSPAVLMTGDTEISADLTSDDYIADVETMEVISNDNFDAILEIDSPGSGGNFSMLGEIEDDYDDGSI
ncbi:hypothetical protein BGZ65_003233 [Modicella reniformis]|uniref:BCAS3 WD40 domain-containing protein n=1 Tax=Modicella reniformis TaxID=1440133 RepID=A0A9P6M2U5_9FUNG|nr:hypothetical protein BGZ65_003233 [Modicella reniformis]